MKFDTEVILKDREGNPLREPVFDLAGKPTNETKPLTQGLAAVRAIDANLPEDKDLKAEIVRKRFILGTKIMAGGIVELTPEEATLIQERVCVFGVAIAGPIIMALDGK